MEGNLKYNKGDIILITMNDNFHDDIYVGDIKNITHVTNLDYIIKDVTDTNKHDGCYFYYKSIDNISVLHKNYLRAKKLERILNDK